MRRREQLRRQAREILCKTPHLWHLRRCWACDPHNQGLTEIGFCLDCRRWWYSGIYLDSSDVQNAKT